MKSEVYQLAKKYTKHLSNLCGLECTIFDVNSRLIHSDSFFCDKCETRCNFHNTHSYGCYEAIRWGGKYIYYCPASYIFIAVSVLNDVGLIDFAVLAGPLIMGDDASDIEFENNSTSLNIPIYTTSKVTDLSEIMGGIFSNGPSLTKKQIEYQKEVLLKDIYKIIDDINLEEKIAYPIKLEKKLQTAIIEGDKALTSKILNELLGHIFFYSNGDLNIIKSRVLELVVLLSRSSIEGGAEMELIFLQNNNYIREVEKFSSLEQLSVWLTAIINSFVSYVFEFNDVKHTDVMHKVTGYIKGHYSEKITLEDIANHVYFSKSYLSKIFKDEMKCGLTAYINNIRIEKSKMLLLDEDVSLVDIAVLVGFDDQSYFTKVFKKIVGVSPGKFRERRGKV
jgi:AraC-like DNA-binding protein